LIAKYGHVGKGILPCDGASFIDWKVIMTTSTMRARELRSAAGRTVLALAFASVIGAVSLGPALGNNDDDNWNKGHQTNQQHANERHDEGDRHGNQNYGYQPYGYQPYGYYAPPPVVYAPPEPSPGINLFFPLEIH
jgi:hypothetical protein